MWTALNLGNLIWLNLKCKVCGYFLFAKFIYIVNKILMKTSVHLKMLLSYSVCEQRIY